MLKVLDLFSGIGGMSLGLERTAGFETVAFCENDPFCSRLLAERWPGVPNLGDITCAVFPEADVITGGFPCQDISRAGKRAGLAGERSGLYRELVRAVRVVRPQYIIVENVAALLGDGMGTVLGDLAESGFDAEWDCIPAQAIGAPHERDRVFIVAHAESEHDGSGDGGAQSGQEPEPRNGAGAAVVANPTRVGQGQRRSRRPPDSFARIRDATRRDFANPVCARLSQREGVEADAFTQLPPAQRAVELDVWQSCWPCEPALLGMDDGVSDRVERTRALGNSLLPQIPEAIGRALLEMEGE